MDKPEKIRCAECNADCTQNYTAAWQDGQRVEGSEKCIVCERGERIARYGRNGVLTTHLLLDATLAHQRWAEFGKGPRPAQTLLDIKHAIDRLQDLVHAFDREVWRPTDEKGLAHVVRNTDWATLTAHPEAFKGLGVAKFHTYTSAGRALLQAETAEGDYVCLITPERYEPEKYAFDIGPPHKMGIQGLRATATTAEALLSQILAAGRAGAITLHQDNNERVA